MKRILVVEDDQSIRETLTMILKLEGYDVIQARNGQEALDVLHSTAQPCVILLDLMMPVMSGWEFLKAQKQDATLASIPVVVVSAAHGEAARPPEANAIVKKPLDIDVLFRVVRQWCGA